MDLVFFKEKFYVLLKEILEAFIAITVAFTIYYVKVPKEFSIMNNILIATCVGIFIIILEWYDCSMKDSLKQGIQAGLGGILIKGAITNNV